MPNTLLWCMRHNFLCTIHLQLVFLTVSAPFIGTTPIINSQNFTNNPLCKDFIMKSPIVWVVLHHSVCTSPIWILSMEKYHTSICLVPLLLDALPLHSCNHCTFVILVNNISLILYPWPFRKQWVHRINHIKLSAPTSLHSVELWVFTFCLVDPTMGASILNVMTPPVWPLMLGGTANNVSTYHFTIPVLSCGNLFHGDTWSCGTTSSSHQCLTHWLLVRKEMATKMSGLAYFDRYNAFATILWNVIAMRSESFVVPHSPWTNHQVQLCCASCTWLA